jgi:hypothetical protein
MDDGRAKNAPSGGDGIHVQGVVIAGEVSKSHLIAQGKYSARQVSSPVYVGVLLEDSERAANRSTQAAGFFIGCVYPSKYPRSVAFRELQSRAPSNEPGELIVPC